MNHATSTTETPLPTAPRLRASDTDRHRVVHLLEDAAARGQLTTDEAGERMAAAYAARHLDELPPLTADLPPAIAPTPVAPGWRALLTLLVLQVRASVAYLTADGLRSRRALAAIAILVVVLGGLVALVITGTHGFDDPHGFHAGPRG